MVPGPADPSLPEDVPRGEATLCLERVAAGDREARNRLFDLVYDDLRSQAAGCLRGERANHTLQPTALVHEAWIRLIDQEEAQVQGRGHFLSLAAMAMRRILVDHARGRGRLKREGGWGRADVADLELAAESEELDGHDLLQVDEALANLEKQSEPMAKVVELRFFGGLSNEEIAEALEVSVPTVKRRWRAAKALMSRLLAGGSDAKR